MTETLTIPVEKVAVSRRSEIDLNTLKFGHEFSDHMFSSTYADGEWKDVKIIPFKNLSLSPANAALHYAQSIFEGLKANRSPEGDILVFRPEANLRRMQKSAERLCMPPIPDEIFMQGMEELIRLDSEWVPDKEGTALYIRPLQFALDPFIGVRPSMSYQFLIMTGPVGAYYSAPVRVKIEKGFTRAAQGGVGAAKTAGNYAASLYPAQLAHEQGYHQLLWTDGKDHEYFEESGTMNIMFVLDDTLITPPLSDSILPGITRDSALTLARDWGWSVEERRISVTELVGAMETGRLKEAFGIGTAATISHIQSVGYEGKDYALPPVETREKSLRLLEELTAIKWGKKKESYGWIHHIS